MSDGSYKMSINCPFDCSYAQPVIQQLTAENKRLQAALQSIAANSCCESCQEARLVALAALEGREPEPGEIDEHFAKEHAALETDEARFHHPVSDEEEAAIDAALEDKG